MLPVRVKGKDASGKPFEELAHTLDLTSNGARLGAIRHELRTSDTLTVFYHQRRMEFIVMWTRLLEGKRREHQVGLQAYSQEKEPWGLILANPQPLIKASSQGAA